MRILYHHWLSPLARRVRLTVYEKRLPVHETIQEDWKRDEEFLALNPAGMVPVLVEQDGSVLCDGNTICEYLEEILPEPALIPGSILERAEVRRLVAWFDQKFYSEVSFPLTMEKLYKRLVTSVPPDSRRVRDGRDNIKMHLAYITWLVDRRNWLAGPHLSQADFAAAAHISLVDYTEDVPWDEFPQAREWYARVKSRPSFRPLLNDQIPGIPAPKHYVNLDF